MDEGAGGSTSPRCKAAAAALASWHQRQRPGHSADLACPSGGGQQPRCQLVQH